MRPAAAVEAEGVRPAFACVNGRLSARLSG